MKKKGFTLIELIAALGSVAILALIVTPLVMSIIRKARVSADKRSIDAYGRSIELAIAGYLLDNGTFPTSIGELTIDYSGEEVVCSTTRLNSDSSVHLAGCRVGGRSVEGYTYGSDKTPTYPEYIVGDEVIYNNAVYRVIKSSGAKESTVTLLKVEPLTYEEIQTYSSGTGALIYNWNGYGGMQYHLRSSMYETSFVKMVVDAWKIDQVPAALDARLITIEEVSKLGYGDTCVEEGWCNVSENVPTWVSNSNYSYWIMSQWRNSATYVWIVLHTGGLDYTGAHSNGYVVRPVITISKSML